MSKSNFQPFLQCMMKGDIDGVRNKLENRFLERVVDEIGRKPIHFACCNGIIEIIEILIDHKCNIESETNEGRRSIHYACENGYFDIVKLLIKNKCNVESKTNDGWRPIDYACYYGYIDIVILLVDQNCEIEGKSGNGKTPCELAKSNGHGDIVKLIQGKIIEKEKRSQICEAIVNDNEECFAELYSRGILTTTDKTSNESWLEMAVNNGAHKIIAYFLDIPIDASEINFVLNVIENETKYSTKAQLWQEVLLFKSIRDQNEMWFQLICSANIINAPLKIITTSFLDVAVEYGCCVFIMEILKKSLFESEKWENVKRMATDNGYYQIERSISKREHLLKFREKANLSILHTAVCDNDPDMVEYILEKNLVDPNLNHEILGTAFSLAILLCHENCMSVLQRYNVDCNTRNKYLQSPLFEAITNGMIDHCLYLIDGAQNVNEEGFMGQTALHCAVMRGCEDLCAQLVKNGADCNQYIQLLRHSSDNKDSENLKQSLPLTERENSLTLCMKINNTIYPCFLEALDMYNVNSSDIDGNTLLHLSVDILDTQLSDTLIQAGANVDSKNKQGHTPLFKLLSKMNQLTFNDNDEKVKKNISNLTKSLVTHSNVDERQSMMEQIFYHTAKLDDNDSFDWLLDIKIINNNYFEDGETILTRLLKEAKFKFCQKILQSETNSKMYMNFKNQKNQTPLQVAIETGSMDIVQHLIFETDNLDNEDNEGRTALMQLFEKINNTDDKNMHFLILNAIKTIISEGGNIYHETTNTGKRIIDLCSSSNTREDIERSFKNKQDKKITNKDMEKIVKVEKIVERRTCKMCLEREIDSVLNCGHTICWICGEKFVRCPFCFFEPIQPKPIFFD